MRGELAARDESAAAVRPGGRRSRASGGDDDDDASGPGGKGAPLPEIDALVARLPAEVRETLDELFRARFVAVKKLPKKALEAATKKAPAAPREPT